MESVLKAEINRSEPSVIISRAPCILHRREARPSVIRFQVKEDLCTGCGECFKLVCPAIEKKENETGNRAFINESQCYGCTVCAQVCAAGAIREK